MNNREEVATNLRALKHNTYYKEEIVENICDAISIADPTNTFREPEDIYNLLADLISPAHRTNYEYDSGDQHMEDNMELVADDNNTVAWRCNNCGEVYYSDPLIYIQYCPNCGEEELDCDDNN